MLRTVHGTMDFYLYAGKVAEIISSRNAID
jgi:hypothetical protein